MAHRFICPLLSRECDYYYAELSNQSGVSRLHQGSGSFTKMPSSSWQLTLRKLRKVKKKIKIIYTVHKQKCQNAGGVHVRELFTVAEVWNLLRLKLKYQLGSQPKLGHKWNTSKSAQEMSRGPAEQSQLFCGCSFPPGAPAEKEKPCLREWEQLKGTSVIAVQCPLERARELLGKCTLSSDALGSWGPS